MSGCHPSVWYAEVRPSRPSGTAYQGMPAVGYGPLGWNSRRARRSSALRVMRPSSSVSELVVYRAHERRNRRYRALSASIASSNRSGDAAGAAPSSRGIAELQLEELLRAERA